MNKNSQFSYFATDFERKASSQEFHYHQPSDLIKTRKEMLSLQKLQQSLELKKNLIEKESKASVINENYLKSKKNRAASIQKYSSKTLERGKELEQLRIDKILTSQKERLESKPKKLAISLNKPGVTS